MTQFKIGNQAQFAVNALNMLQVDDENKSVSLEKIAKHFDISDSYSEQIFSKLMAAGLVVSKRGPKGGYSLSRTPNQISLRNILEAFGEPVPKSLGEFICELVNGYDLADYKEFSSGADNS